MDNTKEEKQSVQQEPSILQVILFYGGFILMGIGLLLATGTDFFEEIGFIVEPNKKLGLIIHAIGDVMLIASLLPSVIKEAKASKKNK